VLTVIDANEALGDMACVGMCDRRPGGKSGMMSKRGMMSESGAHARKLYGPETWLERIATGWHELDGRWAARRQH